MLISDREDVLHFIIEDTFDSRGYAFDLWSPSAEYRLISGAFLFSDSNVDSHSGVICFSR